MGADEIAVGATVPPSEVDRVFAAHVRAARALLEWSQKDLAEASNLSRNVIARLERGETDARSSTINAIRSAFAQKGIEFFVHSDGRPGLIWRP